MVDATQMMTSEPDSARPTTNQERVNKLRLGDDTMNNNNDEDKQDANNLNGFLAGFVFLGGLLLGGLAGAGAMLLLAPQSGRKTRRQIKRKSRKVRKQTAVIIHDGVDQIRDKTHQVTSSLQDQAEELQQYGQDVVGDQKERWSPVVEAGLTAVQDA